MSLRSNLPDVVGDGHQTSVIPAPEVQLTSSNSSFGDGERSSGKSAGLVLASGESNHSSIDMRSSSMPPPDFSQFDDSEDDEQYHSSGFHSDNISIERIRQYLSDKLGFYSSDSYDDKDGTPRKKVLDTVDIDGVIQHWKNGGFKKIVTMVGAGISTSAGIPDFRSPDTGLYNNLMKYNLPYPQAIFELEYFYQNPKPFFQLAKELYPGTFKPTPSHYFVKLLQQKGLLIRHYTQNIDTLERIAGISEDKIVEAHGTFFTNHCLQCKIAYPLEFVKEKIFADEIPTCACGGVIKPDIVFFGEGLPERFHVLPHKDFAECDLLIIMGTSLTVQPFASLVEYVNDDCVRLLINRDKVGGGGYGFFRAMMFGEGLCFDLPGNRRDVAWTGDCDDGCFFLADKLGMGDELREMIKIEHAKLEQDRPKMAVAATPELASSSPEHVARNSHNDASDDTNDAESKTIKDDDKN
ncbi:NAD-dependent protein deacetylase Sirt2 [Toxorhynchites rutilus septentrionalis]|uniref:NAD-dependent protein deacetylase Sirt2 n=1 Tax=Toxorhynchites rutilus septentrionalis TaxID=329112 RepID=UPI002479B6F3|nr:NAD-dependent protein deacetylase Sirt2 [Toxorhynchites rutilus septentrionalis]